MLLYITTGEARDREVRPLHTIPETVNALFYLAMREHARPAVVRHWADEQWVSDPDWRFDRQVIRVALFLSGNLQVGAEDRVAVFGPLRPMWLYVDFAVQGLRGVPVGLSHDLSDDQLGEAVRDSGARVAVATDAVSATRLLALRQAAGIPDTIILPDRSDEGTNGIVGHGFLWDRSQVLDTPERAQNWRGEARKAEPDDVAGIHYAARADGTLDRVEFSHGDAIDFVRDRVLQCAPQAEDVVLFEAVGVTPTVRMAWYTYVGDGQSVLTLPSGRPDTQPSEVGATKLVASAPWLQGLASKFDDVTGRTTQQRMRALLGEGLRWVEPSARLAPEVERRLFEAGIPLPAAVPQSQPGP